jgi:hypothetical protein
VARLPYRQAEAALATTAPALTRTTMVCWLCSGVTIRISCCKHRLRSERYYRKIQPPQPKERVQLITPLFTSGMPNMFWQYRIPLFGLSTYVTLMLGPLFLMPCEVGRRTAT